MGASAYLVLGHLLFQISKHHQQIIQLGLCCFLGFGGLREVGLILGLALAAWS